MSNERGLSINAYESTSKDEETNSANYLPLNQGSPSSQIEVNPHIDSPDFASVSKGKSMKASARAIKSSLDTNNSSKMGDSPVGKDFRESQRAPEERSKHSVENQSPNTDARLPKRALRNTHPLLPLNESLDKNNALSVSAPAFSLETSGKDQREIQTMIDEQENLIRGACRSFRLHHNF